MGKLVYSNFFIIGQILLTFSFNSYVIIIANLLYAFFAFNKFHNHYPFKYEELEIKIECYFLIFLIVNLLLYIYNIFYDMNFYVLLIRNLILFLVSLIQLYNLFEFKMC